MMLSKKCCPANTQSLSIDNEYGRWITVKMGTSMNKIAIITSYIVGKREITPTKNKTAAYQQWLITSCNREPGHLREKSKKDLIRHVESLQEEGNHIIIALDANIKRTDKQGIIEKLKNQCQQEQLVHRTRKTPTHQEGIHQIDFSYDLA